MLAVSWEPSRIKGAQIANATGSVSGVNNVGGLMGESLGSISNSYAAYTVTGVNNVGGLVGSSE